MVRARAAHARLTLTTVVVVAIAIAGCDVLLGLDDFEKSPGGGGSGGINTATSSSSSTQGGAGGALPSTSSSGKGGSGGGAATWHKAGYGHRRALVIAAGKVTGSHSGFPVLVDIDETLTGVGVNAGDLVFVDADGNDLSHEVDAVDGEGVRAWVKMPMLGTAGAKFYVYYDGPTIAAAGDVWSNGFVSVFHLDDVAGTMNTMVLDSVGNSIANIENTMAASNSAAAQISAGLNLDGNNDRVVTSLDVTNQFTLSIWISPDDLNSSPSLMARFGTGDGFDWYVDSGGGGMPSLGFYAAGQQLSTAAPVVAMAWQYVVAVVDFGAGTVECFHDGVSLGVMTGFSATNTDELHVIGGYGSNGNYYFNGKIDEARYASTLRTAAWLKTEYDNQAAPTEFVTLGAEDVEPTN